ncbi:MAG: hypothetical protein WD597_02325, partial [Balneolaceae bacterium]
MDEQRRSGNRPDRTADISNRPEERTGDVSGVPGANKPGSERRTEDMTRSESRSGDTVGSSQEDMPMLTGLFRDRKDAEDAYNGLLKHGFTEHDITLIMSEDTRKEYFDKEGENTEMGNKAMEGTGAGSAIGGTVGAAVGIIAAVGSSIVVPGLGLAIAGPIAGGLAGAGAGGLTGGLIGALVGAGIPEDKAKLYKEEIKNGGIVVGVKPRNEKDTDYIETEWQTRAEEI